jgi:hydroxypyruvate reductase
MASLLHDLKPEDLVVCLISGGGSALLASPVDGVSLEDLQAVTDALLRAGANINQLNTVRKHLERLKGGGLARLAAPAQVASLVLSDVIGDPLDVIASGPTSPDSTTFADAWRVVEQLGVGGDLPDSVGRHLERGRGGQAPETPKDDDPIFAHVVSVIVGSNSAAAAAAVAAARERGWSCLDLGSMIAGEAREVGRVLGGIARGVVEDNRPDRPPMCIVAGGETVVTVRGAGRGGRNQEVALGAALAIQGLPDTLVCSLGTDGTDGPTDAAGAVADGGTLRRAEQLGLDPHKALADNDTYAFFDALGDLLITGPTRTNVNDLMCVFVGMPHRASST